MPGPDDNHWSSPVEIARDLLGTARRLRDFARGKVKGELPLDFQERIMLAVTSVNRCRYCTFVHTRAALAAGISPEDAAALLEGSVDAAPEDEATALLYAQHWAETRGEPDPACRERLVQTYGEAKAEAIEAAIRMIMVGNYTGNTVDHALDRLTGGFLGRWRHAGGAGIDNG